MRKEVTGMGYCYMNDFIDNNELESYIVQNYGYFKEIHDDFIGVSIVAHYQVMIDLVNDLIKHTSFTLENIELYDSEVDGYCDEYILTLDYDRTIWVQKALIPKNKYNDGGYVLCDEDLILVHEDVNSKFLIRNSEANIVVFSVENDGEEDNAEENTEDDEIGCDTECTEDNNCAPSDDLHGFTFSEEDDFSTRRCSFWCSEKLGKNDYAEIINILRRL